jgi:hypothetical protein
MTMTKGIALAADHQAMTAGPADEPHHFDARVTFNRGFKQTPLAESLQAATAMAREIRDLAVTYDDTTGAVRSLSNHTGYLSEGKRGPDALSVAMDFVRANLTSLGLSPADLENYEVTDRVHSKVTGATHIYLRQLYQGLPVFNGQLHVNVNRDGRIISINNSCMPGMAGAARTVATTRPAVDLASAVKSAAQHLGLPLERAPLTLRSATNMQGVTSVDHSRLSLSPIEGRLMWLPIRQGMMNLVWNFQIHTLDKQHIYDFTVDAASGQVWTRFDWIAQDQYRVYSPTPDRDGNLDNGIVIHEYGHGISNRLVGGPSNVDCLTNDQQPGEGLSDFWALAYTAEVGDQGTDPRGVGTYALGQPTSGPGIRPQRYSTDPAVNTWTYASINGMRIPHGVGSVWAQAAWEVYWALVNRWSFDPNLYNALGSAGNQRMMLYVNEGLKNTACNPTFTQVRDGIIQAATDNHGGEDVCRDDFETDQGWTVNPSGTDTATTGRWERGDPQSTDSGGPKQLGAAVSGVNDLVTGAQAGTSAGVEDIDAGVTSIRSQAITLPSSGNLELSFSYYLAHGSNASSADFLRVRVLGTTTTTVFEELGAADNDDGA